MKRLLSQYKRLDGSPQGSTGIDLDGLLQLSELNVYSMAPCWFKIFMDESTKRIHPEGFIKMAAALSSKTALSEKKECENFDIRTIIAWGYT